MIHYQTLEAWKIRLRNWGYKPVFCSVESKQGLDTLKFTLRDQTTVIVGPSGVGKSSLINALRNTHSITDTDNWLDHMVGSLILCGIYSLSFTCLIENAEVRLFACATYR